MIAEILRVEDKRVILNPTILLIPEFKTLWKHCKSITWFAHLHFMYYPEGAYANLTEEERIDMVNADFPDVDIYCPQYVLAKEKYIKLCTTTTKRIFDSIKITADKLSQYHIDSAVTDGREGNVTQMTAHVMKGTQLMKAFNESETAYKEELISARGGEEMTNDEGVNYDQQ